MPNKKPQVVYLHGLQSSGQSATCQRLRRALPKHEVITPDLAVPPEMAMTELKRLASLIGRDAARRWAACSRSSSVDSIAF